MVGIKWKSFSDSVSTLVPGNQTVLSPRPAEFSPGPAAVETTEKCSLPSLQPLLHLNEFIVLMLSACALWAIAIKI